MSVELMSGGFVFKLLTPNVNMKYNLQSLFYVLYTMLAAGFLADGSRQEKASVRLPCLGKKLAANKFISETTFDIVD